jgi:hypothetical protein
MNFVFTEFSEVHGRISQVQHPRASLAEIGFLRVLLGFPDFLIMPIDSALSRGGTWAIGPGNMLDRVNFSCALSDVRTRPPEVASCSSRGKN